MEIGNNVFDFEAKAYFPEEDNIKTIKLKDYLGKWVIMTFYPGDFTFVCATDIEALMDKYNDFKKEGAEVFAISTDTVYSHKGWVQVSPRVSKSKIPMIEDPKKEITNNYGFLNSQTGMSRRGIVIIDPEGKLQYFAVFNDALGKDVEHLLYAFKGLKTIHDTKTENDHICIIPARSKEETKPMDIDTVKDIGKL